MRGQSSLVGHKRVAPNGYHYIRTLDGWRLYHHVIAEEKLGRKINSETETVRFKDGNRDNLLSSNIEVRPKKLRSRAARIAVLEAKIADLRAELEELKREEMQGSEV